MNKGELITSIAEKTELSKKNVELCLNAFMESVVEALKRGDKAQLIGFGTFEVRDRAERKGRNPQTNEELVIPATKAAVFKVGKLLKDAVK